MSLYLTESQILQRYVDCLKEAKDCAIRMVKSPLDEQPKIFIQFIDVLKKGAGCCHQLAHSRDGQNTKWLVLRDNLEKIIDLGKTLPSLTKQNNGAWLQISKVLGQLVEHGKKLYDTKAMTRAETLFDLDLRQRAFVSDPTKV